MLTQEYAKQPEKEVRVRCPLCRGVYHLPQYIKEEPMRAPYETVVEGFLRCPTPGCTYRKHSYYMPEHVRFAQKQLSDAQDVWQEKRTNAAYREYLRRYNSFQKTYTAAQEKYEKIFGEKKQDEPVEA